MTIRIDQGNFAFCRVSGLLKSGALKPSEKPLWYDIYAAHPPAVEPKMSRPVPTEQPVDIIYIEDVLRV